METKINKYSSFSKLLLLILLAVSFVWMAALTLEGCVRGRRNTLFTINA